VLLWICGDSMTLKEKILNYVPFNEQEVKDKEYFLKFIDSFDDVLTRDNVFGHFCSSAYVVNKDRSKLLLVYHNIFDGYIFPGGHVDGESDFLSVAIREVEEETGIKPKLIDENIFSIWVGPVKSHVKRGNFVSSHSHLDVDFLFEADDDIPLRIKPDENKNVIWAPIEEIGKSIKLVDFFVPEFRKFVEKMKRMF